jgi:DNA-binding transcriptional LysR family regulator
MTRDSDILNVIAFRLSAMNLRQLEVFHAIMQTGSVTAAARSLNVTQPAISAVLKHTEQTLKMRLFERIGGRLVATPEAMAVLPDVNEIFGRIDTLNRTMQEMRDGRAGRIVVATSPTLVNAYLPSAVGLFRCHSPNVEISIQSLPTPLAIERVARREADMGLVYAPILEPGVDAEDLATTEIACVVPKMHRLARKRNITVQDLTGESVISLGSRTMLGMLIEEESAKAGVASPGIHIEASSSLTACLMVSEGAGVALVDRATAASRKFADLTFRPFRPTVSIPVKLIYPRGRPRSMATISMANMLLKVAAQNHGL